MSSYNIVNDSNYAIDWYSDDGEKTADYEMIAEQSLQKLRISSRKLLKNEAVAAGTQKAYIDQILGGKVNVVLAATNKVNQQKHQDFLDSVCTGLDINRVKTLSQINETLVASAFSDGDVLITLPIDKSLPEDGIRTYVELVEASRIKTRPKDRDNPLVREGVEYLKNGKIKGYWIKTEQNNPDAFSDIGINDDYTFFPVFRTSGSVTRRVAWLFSAVTTDRPDQSRQVPVLTPVMELLRYYGKYLEAVLVGARVAACFSAFVKTNNPADAKKSLEGSNVKGKLVALKPGTISYLRKNEDIVFASPNKPSDNFDSFIVRLQKIFSMAMRVSFSQLFLDLKDANYSSWRAGSLAAERNITRWRKELTSINIWLVQSFLLEALSKGILRGSLKNETIKIRYAKYKTLDEEKTARANRMKLQNQTISKQMIIEEEGNDYTEVKDEQLEEERFQVDLMKEKLLLEKEYSEEYGILFGSEGEDGSIREPEKNSPDGKVTEEDKEERRKEDGNW
jgi:lambda family phage portal protein